MICRFPNIIYIKGSPLLSEDLQRANINNAGKAVIMSQMNFEDTDQMLDAESIFIFKAIKKCNDDVQIMIELVYPSNIEFLLDKDSSLDNMGLAKSQDDFAYEYTSIYAAGEVYISALIDTLTCQSYFNPHIVTILQKILTGGKNSDPTMIGICDSAGLKQSNLWQIPVPEDYLNKTFGELFTY